MSPSAYRTDTWQDHPLYICGCGYNTTAVIKMEGHQAVCRWEAPAEPPPPAIFVEPQPPGSPPVSPDPSAPAPTVTPDTAEASGTQSPAEEAPHA